MVQTALPTLLHCWNVGGKICCKQRRKSDNPGSRVSSRRKLWRGLLIFFHDPFQFASVGVSGLKAIIHIEFTLVFSKPNIGMGNAIPTCVRPPSGETIKKAAGATCIYFTGAEEIRQPAPQN
jgi:hypothetical protein